MELNRNLPHRSPRRPRQGGMSLIELMIAMVVLAVGMGAIMGLFVMAIGNNTRNKVDTAGTLVAQLVLEQITAVPGSINNATSLVDCAGTTHTVFTAPGGSPVTAAGNVDFTAAAVAGYRMLYVTCGAGGQQVTYDVRWNVQRPSAVNKLVTVTARPLGAGQAGASPRLFALPTTLRTIVGA